MMTNLANLIMEEQVSLDLSATDKEGVLKEMIMVLEYHEQITDTEELLCELQDREALGSTGIGDGIAIPHVRTELVKEMMITFGRSDKGVNFEALDNKPVHLFFLIVAPKEESSKLMRILAKLCRLLKDKNFRQALLDAQSKQMIIGLIVEKNRY